MMKKIIHKCPIKYRKLIVDNIERFKSRIVSSIRDKLKANGIMISKIMDDYDIILLPYIINCPMSVIFRKVLVNYIHQKMNISFDLLMNVDVKWG